MTKAERKADQNLSQLGKAGIRGAARGIAAKEKQREAENKEAAKYAKQQAAFAKRQDKAEAKRQKKADKAAEKATDADKREAAKYQKASDKYAEKQAKGEEKLYKQGRKGYKGGQGMGGDSTPARAKRDRSLKSTGLTGAKGGLDTKGGTAFGSLTSGNLDDLPDAPTAKKGKGRVVLVRAGDTVQTPDGRQWSVSQLSSPRKKASLK